MAKKLVIFTDVGDTIVDESTEIRKERWGVVYDAKCIPGAKETMRRLYDAGYTIVMVADGLSQSFHNTMDINGLSDIFSAWVISEEVGIEKPSPRMFQRAMDVMGFTEADKKRIIMVGNNPLRDVPGANNFGITSVLLDWSPRYDYTRAEAGTERFPDYRIHRPEELWDLCEKLEAAL